MATPEPAISKFNENCLSEGKIVRQREKSVAKLSAVKPEKKKLWLGSMKGKMEILGDIIGPIGAFDGWDIDGK